MAEIKTNLVIDGLTSFDKGVNSGLEAFSLPPDQLAFAVNATVRGNFITNRPPFQVQSLPAAVWQTVNSVGIFQGACYCAPDTGQQFLIAQIGGRLFTFTPDVNDVTVVVAEVTIPGDPNPSGLPQAWLCQAERWVIVQNGVNNPIFYDSTTNTSRRSVPDSTSQATTDPTSVAPTGQFVTPSIGGTVEVPLAALGNIAAFINEAVQLVEYDNSSPPQVTATTSWEVTSVGGAATTYNVTLKNLGDTAGATQGSGSGLSIQPSNIGNILAVTNDVFVVGPHNKAKMTITVASNVPSYLAVGALVSVNGYANWKVKKIHNDNVSIDLEYQTEGFDVFLAPGWVYPVGQSAYAVANTQPNTTVGILAASFTAPAIGATVATTLSSPYTAALNQILFINNKEYQVTAFSSTTGTATNNITLLNLNDSRLGHVFNAITIPATTTATQIFNFPELPPGRMMAYCQGRVWESLTDAISFIAGDIVGGAAGSPAFAFRDAVLKVSENSLISGGGSFKVPANLGQITAMRTTAQLDASLGQGPLMVVTPGGIFSCSAPADRTTWSTLTTPIVSESLIGLGGLSQNSTIVVNGDLLFRAVDGIRSLIMAKREFYSWGNTPISFEMNRVLARDNVAGLPYASAVQFDNRLLMTCVPTQGPQGVYNQGLVALNFDPVSSLQGKSASVYDGFWTGINVLQLIEGQFSGVHRCFAFTYNASLGKIELYEILKTGDGDLDNGSAPIIWSFETPMLFKDAKGKSLFDLCCLEDSEFYVKDIQPGQTVGFKVQYRPDFSTCWFDWHEFSFCNDPQSTQPVYGARLGLGRPDTGGITGAGSTSANFGRWFQKRYIVSGHCVFMGCKVTASLQPQTGYATPISVKPSTPIQCP